MYRDTCNVYVVKDGPDAVLVDFGDGGVLDELPSIGVERVAAILMTHHHRDQGQGLPKAEQRGIPIWVPHAEQDLFARVDAHWQGRVVRNNYFVRQDRFSLLEPVRIAGTLVDYAEWTCGSLRFLVVPTPGHTTGSITLMTELQGRTYAFCGDLIYGPGKVWSMAATQWTYNGAEGVPASIASLLDVKERRPDALLPSHGEPMERPAEAIDPLVERLRQLLRYRGHNARLFELRDRPYERVTEHLLRSRAAFANYYVLLSASGKALLLDFGYDFATGIVEPTDRASRRPWLYSIPRLKRQFGVARIEAVLLTHYHDDHVAGCNALRQAEGAEVWAAEHFADVLERPEAYDLPCLWYDPIPVDRKIALDAPFRWEEYEIELHALPGHTRYAAAISFEADGKRVLVTGDQYQGNDGLQYNYVYQNGFQIDDYVRSAELYRRLRPDVILTGHWEPLWVEPGYYDALDERGAALARLHAELLPLEDADFGADGFGCVISPYEFDLAAGDAAEARVEVRNPFPTAAEATVTLVLPEGWTAPPARRIRLEPRQTAALAFAFRTPEGLTARRRRIAADVTVGGKRLGQLAEALVNVHADIRNDGHV